MIASRSVIEAIALRSAIGIVIDSRSAIGTTALRSGTALHSVTASRSAQSETTDASASGASGRPLAGGCIGFGFAANADGIAEIQLVMRERKACAPSKRNFIAGKVALGEAGRHGSSTLGRCQMLHRFVRRERPSNAIVVCVRAGERLGMPVLLVPFN